MMTNQSLTSLGANVVLATSGDENHPPENIIDGNTDTFWMSTGMFPQEFTIRFAEPTKIAVITLDCYNVKDLKIEKNTSDTVSNFECIAEKEFEHTEGQRQSLNFSLNETSATHLRFIIASGYDHFVSVHRVSVES
ncbi:intraflagellar transport protein 25 homolog [Lampris incognitus]|uniref:intraflagellar transport protein 25 homolog n=1 Tax=Lampris incognitus TaxID=2546036 RepID=UPI0024B563B2|nr:intraflagellar transport protein 25 homolog [Lampris incognitus]